MHFMIILLALLDDIPIMTIAYDNTRLSRRNSLRKSRGSSLIGNFAPRKWSALSISRQNQVSFQERAIQLLGELQASKTDSKRQDLATG